MTMGPGVPGGGRALPTDASGHLCEVRWQVPASPPAAPLGQGVSRGRIPQTLGRGTRGFRPGCRLGGELQAKGSGLGTGLFTEHIPAAGRSRDSLQEPWDDP